MVNEGEGGEIEGKIEFRRFSSLGLFVVGVSV